MSRLQERLIEGDFPLRRVSEASVREKNIRHGHISTLHTIQDPTAKLYPEEQVEIVRYVVRNWQEASHEGEPM